MIQFVPLWQTSNDQPLDNSPISEGSVASFDLEAEDVGTAIIPFSSVVSTRLPSTSQSISEVSINGNVLDNDRYSVQGRNLVIDLAGLGLAGNLSIRVKRQNSLTFSLLHGTLPPGLVLLSNGTIGGTVQNVLGDDTIAYEFTVRVANETKLRDRSFIIRVNPVPSETVWATSGLPIPETDDILGIDYYPLGDLKRLETKLVPLDARDPDNEPFTIEVRPTGLTGAFFEGLPDGLTVTGNILRGTISSAAAAGRYLFRLGFVGQATQAIFGEIKVQDATAITTFTPSMIEWTSPENLGTVPETFPCEVKITAQAGAQKVTYDLAPGSGPLPPGIGLNPSTGDLQGMAGHVGTQMTYRFTIRAKAGAVFSDRQFSLTVGSRYDTPNVLDVRLKLRTRDRVGMVERYKTLIPQSAVYRRTDRFFGIPQEPYVYLIKGLRGTSVDPAMTGDGTNGPFGNDYHGQFKVLLGRHYGAVARDATGNVIYEVIYRTILDPQALAGGFKFGTKEAVEDRVLYPQSKAVRQYIYPRSIRNARMDFVRDLGFATSQSGLVRLTETGGVEAMPTWMTCRQDLSDPNSVIGYIPALVVAYVLPGEAAAIINTLNNDAELPPTGRQITFERYYTFEHVTKGGTTFDGAATTFDGDTTVFDVI